MLNENLLSRLLVMPAFVGVALMAAVPAFAADEKVAGTADLTVSELTVAETLDDKSELTPPSLVAAANGQTVAPIAETPAVEVAPVAADQPAVVAQSVELETEIAETPVASVQDLAPAQDGSGSMLDEMAQYTEDPLTTEADPMGQVTSITQFSDVQPTDWAYQALQSLVERYGCIVGYPDGTYRGQRALTRFEFAAGMNACLDRISELLAASTADLATKEDLATLQRLQEEFAAELAALRGRVDVLDTRVTELEANQFSTTTKLNGETIFAAYDLFGGGLEEDNDDDDGDGNDLGANNELAVGYRVRLAFDTSFTGTDRLRARLQAANIDRFNTATLDGNVVLGNDGRLGFDTNTSGEFQVDILSYLFSVGDVALQASALQGDFTDFDFINPVSPFASSGRGAISRFGRYNPIYRTASGSGFGASFNFIDEVTLQLAYLAGEATNPDPGSGLFNGDYGALAQLTIKPFDALTLAFTYVNSYSGSVENTDGTFSANGFNTGTGSLRSRVRVGDQPIVANSYGASVNFRVASFLQIGGWFGYSAVRVIETGDAQVWNYAATIGFPDLGKKGSLLGFVVGVQPYLGGTNGFEVSDGNVLGRSDDNGLHVEGFYRFQLNDNISITPGLIWLAAPNNNLDNDDIFIGALRTTFTF